MIGIKTDYDFQLLFDKAALNLTGNELEGEIPSELGRLTRLTFLDLSNNLFSGLLPPQIGQLTALGTYCLLDLLCLYCLHKNITINTRPFFQVECCIFSDILFFSYL